MQRRALALSAATRSAVQAGGGKVAMVTVALLLLAGTGCCMAATTPFNTGASSSAAKIDPKIGSKTESLCADMGSHFVFEKYAPSQWENEWLVKGEERYDSICKTMVTEKDNTIHWLESVKTLKDGPDYSQLRQFDHRVWSRFVYTDVCKEPGHPDRTLEVYIEPVVGLLRHPLAIAGCVYDGAKEVHAESRDHLTAVGMTPKQFRAMYPGKAYLFDLGTGTNYSSSLQWFVDEHALHGIQFNQVFGWEIKDIDQDNYWSTLPPAMASRVQLHNSPVRKEPNIVGQALQLLSSIYKPGDYVVIKLDIDHTEIEHALLARIRDEPRLRRMIGSIWFEPHHTAPEMIYCCSWSWDDYPYHKTLQLFNEFRSLGIRLHTWP